MKLSTFSFVVPILALGLVMASNSSGPASAGTGDRTGSPVSSGNCTACHSTGSSGSFNPSIAITVTDAQANPITEYIPGLTYTISYQVSSTTGNPSFGIQSTGLLSNNTAAGTASSPSTGAKVTPLNGRWYFEHSQRSNSGSFSFQWTAPAQGSGSVTLYTSALAVNGSFTSGDNWTSSQVTLTEGTASSTIAIENFDVNVYPNPCINELILEGSNIASYQIFDYKGQLIKQSNLNGTQSSIPINVSELTSGMYLVRIMDDKQKTTAQSFLKQ